MIAQDFSQKPQIVLKNNIAPIKIDDIDLYDIMEISDTEPDYLTVKKIPIK